LENRPKTPKTKTTKPNKESKITRKKKQKKTKPRSKAKKRVNENMYKVGNHSLHGYREATKHKNHFD
jgi:hypothetical protein